MLPYDFRYGPPSFTDFPHETWCRIVARRARRITIRDLDYGTPEGLPALREAIAEYVGRARAIACTPDQILVVNGSQQALDLAARVLVDPGDVVLMEEPHYRGARTVMKAAGARIETIEVDEHGLRTAELAQRRTLSRLAIVTPSHQFPTGAVMPLGRRLELLAWARRSGACIFEDDYDSEYRYSGRPIEALAALDDSACVLYAATFSKVMFPSLRLGYMILPERLVEPIRSVKALMDTGGPHLAQAALVDFIREGHFERHLHRTRTRNASRRAAMLEAIERHLGSRAQVSGDQCRPSSDAVAARYACIQIARVADARSAGWCRRVLSGAVLSESAEAGRTAARLRVDAGKANRRRHPQIRLRRELPLGSWRVLSIICCRQPIGLFRASLGQS